jgi:hypothetical protein
MASATFNVGRQSFPLVLTGSLMLAVLFFVRYFTSPWPVEAPFFGGMPLAASLTRWSVAHSGWSGVAGFVLMVWTILIVIQLSGRYVSVNFRNYLPIPIFIITACGIFVSSEALVSYLAAWLLALSTRQFMLTFRKDYRFVEAFRGGLYLGFIPLLYAPGAILLVLVPILSTLYRRSARELTVGIVGALLPLLGAWFIGWAMGGGVWYLFDEWWRLVAHRVAPLRLVRLPITAIVCGGALIALTAIAIGWFVAQRKGMRTRQRKAMTHIALVILLVVLSFLAPGASLSGWPMLAVPLAMAIPYAFTFRQSIVSSVLYIIIIIATLVVNSLALSGISVL